MTNTYYSAGRLVETRATRLSSTSFVRAVLGRAVRSHSYLGAVLETNPDLEGGHGRPDSVGKGLTRDESNGVMDCYCDIGDGLRATTGAKLAACTRDQGGTTHDRSLDALSVLERLEPCLARTRAPVGSSNGRASEGSRSARLTWNTSLLMPRLDEMTGWKLGRSTPMARRSGIRLQWVMGRVAELLLAIALVVLFLNPPSAIAAPKWPPVGVITVHAIPAGAELASTDLAVRFRNPDGPEGDRSHAQLSTLIGSIPLVSLESGRPIPSVLVWYPYVDDVNVGWMRLPGCIDDQATLAQMDDAYRRDRLAETAFLKGMVGKRMAIMLSRRPASLGTFMEVQGILLGVQDTRGTFDLAVRRVAAQALARWWATSVCSLRLTWSGDSPVRILSNPTGRAVGAGRPTRDENRYLRALEWSSLEAALSPAEFQKRFFGDTHLGYPMIQRHGRTVSR